MITVEFNPSNKFDIVSCHDRIHYVQIDYRNRSIDVGTQHESVNATDAWIYYGHGTRYWTANGIDAMVLKKWINDVMVPLATIVCDGYDTKWDGNNTVGILSMEANEAYSTIEKLVEEMVDDPMNFVETFNVRDWDGDVNLATDASDTEVDALADEWIATLLHDTDGIFIGGKGAVIENIREVLEYRKEEEITAAE